MRKLSGLLSLCFTMETVSFFSHHFYFFIISLRSPLFSHCSNALLKAHSCFQGCSFMLLAISLTWFSGYWRCISYPNLWRLEGLTQLRHSPNPSSLSVCIYLFIYYLSLLSLSCIWCIERLNISVVFTIFKGRRCSFLSSEAQLACN